MNHVLRSSVCSFCGEEWHWTRIWVCSVCNSNLCMKCAVSPDKQTKFEKLYGSPEKAGWLCEHCFEEGPP